MSNYCLFVFAIIYLIVDFKKNYAKIKLSGEFYYISALSMLF